MLRREARWLLWLQMVCVSSFLLCGVVLKSFARIVQVDAKITKIFCTCLMVAVYFGRVRKLGRRQWPLRLFRCLVVACSGCIASVQHLPHECAAFAARRFSVVSVVQPMLLWGTKNGAKPSCCGSAPLLMALATLRCVARLCGYCFFPIDLIQLSGFLSSLPIALGSFCVAGAAGAFCGFAVLESLRWRRLSLR